jgi:pimeloyl-ACP methyl ester carboxylesterase
VSAREYVLVHGAWHGAWCWSRVAPMLAAAAHRVLAPTLTGLGDRAHLAGAQVALGTHVQDVLGAIEAEELGDAIVLVGHSYGGNVITGVADALRGRIAHCVFLDAVVPPPDATRWSWSMFNSAQDRAARLRAVREQGGGVVLPPPAAAALGVDDPADAAWLERRMRPMPLGTYLGEIALRHGGTEGLPRTYVAAAAPAYPPMRPIRERLRTDPTWRYLEIATGHDMMVSAPQVLCRLLLEA